MSDVQSLCPTRLDDEGILGKENLVGADVACRLSVGYLRTDGRQKI